MKRYLWLSLILGLFATSRAHASVCATLSGSPSQSTLQSAINSCGSGNQLNLVAGNTTITSSLTWACGVSIVGPTVAVAPGLPGVSPTAKITTSGFTGYSLKYPAGCTVTGVVLRYIELDGGGGNGSNGGGGGVQIGNFGNGGTGPDIEFNWFHGMQPDTSGGGENNNSDQGIFVTTSLATNTTNLAAATWNNLVIKNNRFGAGTFNNASPGNGDCSAAQLMQTFFYPASTQAHEYNNNGGYCGGVQLGANTSNLVISNNDFFHLEEPIKFYEPSSNSGQQGCVSTLAAAPNQYCHNNSKVDYNDFSNTHRIAIEAQDTPNTVMEFNFGSWHDCLNCGYGSWIYSLPQDNDNTNCVGSCNFFSNADYNVLVANQPQVTLFSKSGGLVPGHELWGNGHMNYNFFQGNISCGVHWGWTQSASFLNNEYQGTAGQVACSEEGSSITPTNSGNTNTSTIAAKTSVTPTISPSSGTFSGSQTVTFTHSGTNRDANTGIWYTTDGTTPTPGSGSAQYISTGGTISVTSTTTVKAVGMWGAFNQPASYPSGYGYVPSSAVSATFTLSGGGTPTASTPTFSPGTESYSVSASVTISDSTPGATIYYTTNGTTPTITSAVYTGPITVTATTTVQAIAIASGYLNSAVGSAVYTLVTPTLSGATISLTGGGSTMALGGSTVQACVNLSYTSPTENTTICGSGTDAYGSTPGGSWVSLGSGLITSSSSGLLTAIAVGSATIEANVGGFTPTLSVTVTSTPPTFASVGVSLSGGGTSILTGSSGQACVTFFYVSPTTSNTICAAGADSFGTALSAFTSDTPGVATIVSGTGAITPVAPGTTNLTASVTGQNVVAGVTANNNSASTSQNAYEADYVIVGSNGLSPQTASIYVASGTSGKHIDLGITQATSPTTQSSSPLCHGTITESGLTNQLLTATLSGCPNLAPGSTVWVWMDTDDAALNVGKNLCGSTASCTGGPTSSTYGDCVATVTYGTYTGFPTTLSSCPGDVQRTQYFTSLPVSPAFVLNVSAPLVPSSLVIQHAVMSNATVSP